MRGAFFHEDFSGFCKSELFVEPRRMQLRVEHHIFVCVIAQHALDKEPSIACFPELFCDCESLQLERVINRANATATDWSPPGLVHKQIVSTNPTPIPVEFVELCRERKALLCDKHVLPKPPF